MADRPLTILFLFVLCTTASVNGFIPNYVNRASLGLSKNCAQQRISVKQLQSSTSQIPESETLSKNSSNSERTLSKTKTSKKKNRSSKKYGEASPLNCSHSETSVSLKKKGKPKGIRNKKQKKTFDRSKSLLSKRKNKKKGGKVKEALKSISDLKLGSKVDGTVASLTPFGAFIKISYDLKDNKKPGYALLHLSQISDEIVEDVSKKFRVGQRIKKLRVITINYAKGEVGLSLRNPRAQRTDLSEINVGDEMVGKVSSVASYGAFVDVGAKVNALVHISRITQEKITNIRDWVNEGDMLSIHIISKDEMKKTMAASMLDSAADDYLDRKSEQIKRIKARTAMNGNLQNDERLSKVDLEYLEDAVKELEEAFGTWTSDN